MNFPMNNKINNNTSKAKSKEQLKTLHDPSILQTLNSQIHTSTLKHICNTQKGPFFHVRFDLNSMRISFNRFYDNDGCISETLKHINKQIKLHMWKNIKRLELDFTKCETDLLQKKNLKALEMYIFSTFGFIEHLSLIFPNASFGVIKGFLAFGKMIGYHFHKLKQLDICVQTFGVDDGTIKSFIKGFKKSLFNLQILRFHIYRSDFVTEKTTERLMKFITKRVGNLKSFEIYFIWCQQITNDSLKIISKEIQKYPNHIENIRLDFTGCLDITYEDKCSFRESLKFIPRVSIWCDEIIITNLDE